MKEDKKNILLKKLSSRKLWAAVISFAVAIGTAFLSEKLDEESISLIISGCVSLWAYILGEGVVDAVRAKNEK